MSGENEIENHETINEVSDNDIEKPVVKSRKKSEFVWTEARKEAFERCRQARQANIGVIQTKKKAEKLTQAKTKLQAKVEQLEEVEAKLPEPPAPAPIPKKKRTPKVIIESDTDEDSASEEEYVVSRVRRTTKAIPPTKPQAQPAQEDYYSYTPRTAFDWA